MIDPYDNQNNNQSQINISSNQGQISQNRNQSQINISNNQNQINQNDNQADCNQNQEEIMTMDSEFNDKDMKDHLKIKKVKNLKKEIEFNKVQQIDDNSIVINVNDKLKDNKLLLDLSEFNLIKPLGNGSFGMVFLVENKHTHQQFAAKVSKKKINHLQKQNDFFNEIELYSKIDYPAILKLHGYSLHNFNGSPFPTMILDYMPNKTLAYFLKKTRKSDALSNQLRSKKYIMLIGIVIGMEFLHSKGIIHRDLKPENILLDENLYPKICDFGISIISDDELLKNQKSREGTPIYLAPEIIFYEAPYSFSVDVYAFALIAYELITGIEPFSNIEYRSKFDIWKAIEKGVRPDLSIIPDPQVRLLIGRCWSRDPTERPSFNQIYTIINQSRLSFGCDFFEEEKYLDIFYEKDHNYPFTKENIKEYADNGNIEAIRTYASMLVYGKGIPQDIDKGLYYYEKGMEQNDKLSTYHYASLLQDSENILDKRRANELYKKLADEGMVPSMVVYGVNLTFGLGCKIDYEEAINYYQMAAKQKNATAMFNLGTMYYRGRGTKVDKQKASEYFQLSADLGNKDAMYEYARMCYIGDGIEKDFEKAEVYFNMAAFQMDTGAMMYLGIMYIDGSVEYNPDKAKYWLYKCGEINKNNVFCSMVIAVFQKINGQYSRNVLLFFINQLKSQIPTNDQSSDIPASNSHAEYFNKVNDSNNNKNNNDYNNKNNNNDNDNDNDDNNNNNVDIQARILHLKQIYKAGQIDEIRANVFQSILYDEKRIFCFVIDSYIPKSIKSDFENKARALKAEIKHNIIQRDDPNDICTYFLFQSYFGIIQFKDYINQIMTKNKYKDVNLIGNTLYMHFDEKMIPPKELPVFIRYLESIQKIKDIQRNIFDGCKVATYFRVNPDDQDDVKSLLKEFLLKKNLIFDTSVYPLENDIIFKEKLILNKQTDFDTIINEILSIRTKNPIVPISIQRDKLYFYNDSCINKLFQISSFICFKNRVEKMEALNHINKIVYKGKNNILHCDLDLHYASIDSDGLPTFIRKSVPEIFQTTEGVIDFQSNVLSIESPVQRSYIGFDSKENLKKGYLRFLHFFNVYLGFRSYTKFFFEKKELFYLYFSVLPNQNEHKVADFVSDLTCDCQLNCTEKIDKIGFHISFLGFKSNDDLLEAKMRIENNKEINQLLRFLQIYDINEFVSEKTDYKECYLFYNSL